MPHPRQTATPKQSPQLKCACGTESPPYRATMSPIGGAKRWPMKRSKTEVTSSGRGETESHLSLAITLSTSWWQGNRISLAVSSGYAIRNELSLVRLPRCRLATSPPDLPYSCIAGLKVACAAAACSES